MKMDIVAGSNNDEFYTPDYAVYPIVKYLKPNSTVWCPFDTEESRYVTILKQKKFNVINTHLDKGQNFFTINPPVCDYVVSNPPYSKKTEVLQRLFAIDIPFAMLLGVAGIFEAQRFDLFRCNTFEIMYFDKRISYFKSYTDREPLLNPPFSSVYICHNILPKQIVFEELRKANLRRLI